MANQDSDGLDRPVGELWVELDRNEKQRVCDALIDRNQPDVLQEFASLVRFTRGYLHKQRTKPSQPSKDVSSGLVPCSVDNQDSGAGGDKRKNDDTDRLTQPEKRAKATVRPGPNSNAASPAPPTSTAPPASSGQPAAIHGPSITAGPVTSATIPSTSSFGSKTAFGQAIKDSSTRCPSPFRNPFSGTPTSVGGLFGSASASDNFKIGTAFMKTGPEDTSKKLNTPTPSNQISGRQTVLSQSSASSGTSAPTSSAVRGSTRSNLSDV